MNSNHCWEPQQLKKAQFWLQESKKKKISEFLPWVGSVHKAFRESSTELVTMLELGNLGTVCRTYFCPLLY